MAFLKKRPATHIKVQSAHHDTVQNFEKLIVNEQHGTVKLRRSFEFEAILFPTMTTMAILAMAKPKWCQRISQALGTGIHLTWSNQRISTGFREYQIVSTTKKDSQWTTFEFKKGPSCFSISCKFNFHPDNTFGISEFLRHPYEQSTIGLRDRLVTATPATDRTFWETAAAISSILSLLCSKLNWSCWQSQTWPRIQRANGEEKDKMAIWNYGFMVHAHIILCSQSAGGSLWLHEDPWYPWPPALFCLCTFPT